MGCGGYVVGGLSETVNKAISASIEIEVELRLSFAKEERKKNYCKYVIDKWHVLFALKLQRSDQRKHL